MNNIIIEYKDLVVKLNLSESCTSIIDSYRIKKIKDMKNIINMVREQNSDPNLCINKRKIFGMITEWRSHNLLYALGIQRERTKTVDLEEKQSFFLKIAYFIMSIFYF